MEKTRFGNMPCPIARSLDRVGEWWSILILRDAFAGKTRFDEFQKNLGIAPNMLTRRLGALVDSGLLEKQRYQDHPPRECYVLTARGRDFHPVLLALLAFGNRHFAPEGPSVEVVDAVTGAPAEPLMIDAVSGRPLSSPHFKLAAGPGATPRTRAELKDRKPFGPATDMERPA